MKIISLQLTKIHAERINELENPDVNNNVQFTNVEKDNSLEILKEHNISKVAFSYTLVYKNKKSKAEKDAEVLMEGYFLLSLEKDEQKEFEKSWKEKKVPENHIETLFNSILRRCTSKAVPIQDELNIPSPFLRVPPVTVQKSDK